MKNKLIILPLCFISFSVYCQEKSGRIQNKSDFKFNNDTNSELLLSSTENDDLIKRSGKILDSVSMDLIHSDPKSSQTPIDSIRLSTDIVDDPKRFNLTLSPQ